MFNAALSVSAAVHVSGTSVRRYSDCSLQIGTGRAMQCLVGALLLAAAVSAGAEVRSLLHEQALSHIAFHSDAYKVGLAQLAVGSGNDGGGLAVIVGVEWGRDVYALADAGFRVVAVEPDAKYTAALRTSAQAQAGRVRVIEAYAGAETDNGSTPKTIALDDELAVSEGEGEIMVLSADVQGGEDKVVKGAERLLSSGRVRTIWVESIACQASALHVLHILARHGYEMYDFVPWGRTRSQHEDGVVPRSIESFAYNPYRLGEIDKYWQWLCDTQRQHIQDAHEGIGFRWLQTDIIAVRKDIHSSEFERNLAKLVNLCRNDAQGTGKGAECTLREHLGMETKETKEAKDEL